MRPKHPRGTVVVSEWTPLRRFGAGHHTTRPRSLLEATSEFPGSPRPGERAQIREGKNKRCVPPLTQGHPRSQAVTVPPLFPVRQTIEELIPSASQQHLKKKPPESWAARQPAWWQWRQS